MTPWSRDLVVFISVITYVGLGRKRVTDYLLFLLSFVRAVLHGTCKVVNIGMDRFSLTSQGFPINIKCPFDIIEETYRWEIMGWTEETRDKEGFEEIVV